MELYILDYVSSRKKKGVDVVIMSVEIIRGGDVCILCIMYVRSSISIAREGSTG